MTDRRRIEGLKRLAGEEFFEEAGLVAMRMHRNADEALRTELEELVAPFAERSQCAALVAAIGLERQGAKARKARIRLLEKAAEGEDESVRAEAERHLGMTYLRLPGKAHYAAHHLHAAADLGDLEAMFELGLAYFSGKDGFPEDRQAGLAQFELCRRRSYAPALFEIARLLEAGEIGHEDYEAEELYEEAASLGHEEAVARLGQIRLEEGPDPDDYDDIPVPFRPDDPVRLRMARNEIVRVFGGTDERAENLVAAMVGHFDFEDAIKEARDREEPGGPFDEDGFRSEDEQSALLEAQAAQVELALGVDRNTAEIVVDLLRLTSNGRYPSLHDLERRRKQGSGRIRRGR